MRDVEVSVGFEAEDWFVRGVNHLQQGLGSRHGCLLEVESGQIRLGCLCTLVDGGL